MKTTPNFGKKVERIEGCSEEGGVSMLDQADKTQLNADIVENLATMKKSAERRSVSPLP